VRVCCAALCWAGLALLTNHQFPWEDEDEIEEAEDEHVAASVATDALDEHVDADDDDDDMLTRAERQMCNTTIAVVLPAASVRRRSTTW